MNQEIWKPIRSFENRYEVSNFGNVYSIKRNKLLVQTPSYQDYRGYNQVCLFGEDQKKHTKLVHKLVAEAFIPNPNNLPQINHINGNKFDNRVDNLEWCTASYNTKHAYDNNLNNIKNTVAKVNKRMFGYVLIVTVKGTEINYFNSTEDAMKFLNYSHTGVTWAIRHNTVTRTGYRIYGFKNKDLQKFANGETLPDVLKAIPWEICLEDKQSCNDYSSEGK